MSKYTTELRYICCTLTGNDLPQSVIETNEIISEAAPLIFDFDFPLFDSAYKEQLEIKILRHFFMREIGFETYGQWKLKLCDTLNMIMPYYNKLYQTETFKFNPLYDVDYSIVRDGRRNTNTNENETKSGTETANSTENQENNWRNNGTNTGTDWDKYSETPQGGLAGIDPDGAVGSYYLTNVRKKNGNTSTTANGSGNDSRNVTASNQTSDNKQNTKNLTDINSYVEHVNGKRGGITYTKMLLEYRSSLLNIDSMIISELNSLFMGLW